VSRKKELKCSFVISPIKHGRFWWNLAQHFLNKFAAKWCKRFPPHLNNVSTLPCLHYLVKLELLIVHVLPLSCYRKKLQNLCHLNCVLKLGQTWIQLITACGKYCKRRCTKHASLIWSYQRRYWRMVVTMTTWSILAYSVLSRYFSSSRSVMRILYTFSCSSPHMP